MTRQTEKVPLYHYRKCRGPPLTTGQISAVQLPLLTFPSSVAFPGVPCAFILIEPRYQRMMATLTQKTERFAGLCLARRDTHFDMHGTLLRLTHVELLSDGRYLVHAIGVGRFRVLQWRMCSDGYPIAESLACIADRLGEKNAPRREPQLPIPSVESRKPEMSAWKPAWHGKTATSPSCWASPVHLRGLSRPPPPVEQLLRVLDTMLDHVPLEPAEVQLIWQIANLLPATPLDKACLLPTQTVAERIHMILAWFPSRSPFYTTAPEICSVS